MSRSKSMKMSKKRRATFYVALDEDGTPRGAFLSKEKALAAHELHGEFDVFTCRISNYQDNHELYCVAHTFWNDKYGFEDNAIRLFVRRIDLLKYLNKKGLLKDGLLESPTICLEGVESESFDFNEVPDSYLRRRSFLFGSSLNEILITRVKK